MDTIIVYTSSTSSRLQYVLDWLLGDRLQLDFKIVCNEAEAQAYPNVISYGAALNKSISIPADGLLMQTAVKAPLPAKGMWNNVPVLYPVPDQKYTLPFDIFAAIFYLLSRQEEYIAYAPDKHSRYPATESILYRNGWLQRPIVDEWVSAFRLLLETEFKIKVTAPQFSFVPTYDIDIAYSYRHKGFVRSCGGFLRALFRMDIKQVNQRADVLRKRQKDPYDSFRWLRQLHKEYKVSPIYFVLCALQTGTYDKNIHPEHPAMARVIKFLAKDGAVGIHPSYNADAESTLQEEKRALEQVAGQVTHLSRQHYIRAVLPYTYRHLLQQGITDDYTMGYGTHLGFRAGTGAPFFWYDLERETQTDLRVHPFCFMDTTAHFELGLTPAQAMERLTAMSKLLQQTGSRMVTIFHNFSLGTDAEWKGWRQAYEAYIQEIVKW